MARDLLDNGHLNNPETVVRAFQILCAALAACGPFSEAWPFQDPIDLGDVVVTVQPMSDPMTVVVDPKTAQQPIPASDGASFLKNIPGFAVSRKGGTDGDAAFRGLGGSRLNVVLDGAHILGGCPHRMDPPTAYVYPESYDRVIVDKGPQSVLYGVGTAATVRFERHTERFESAGYRGSAALVGGSFGRNDQMFDLAGGDRRGFVRVIGTRSDADSYEDGDGREVRSFYTRWSGTALAGWTPDDNTRVEFTVERSDGEAAYADRAMDGAMFDRVGYSLDLERAALDGVVNRLAVKLFHNNIDHVMDNFSLRLASGTKRVMNPERSTSGGRIAADLTVGDAGAATFGVDYQQNDHTARMAMAMMGVPTIQGRPRRDKARFDRLGAFGEVEYALNPATRLVAGARIDRSEAEAEQSPSRMDPDGYGGAAPGQTDRNTDLSGFLRIERDLAAVPGTLYAGAGHAVRPPDFWERDRVFSLEPERHTQLDLGFSYDSDQLHANAALFYADIDSYIQVTEGGSGAANIDAATYGGEADMRYALSPHWDLGATLSYVRGRNYTDDVPLAQMPPLEGSVALDYHRDRLSVGLLIRAVADQDRIDPGRGTIFGTDIGETSGFTVVSLNAAYRWSNGVTLAAGMDNLFDETYSEHLGKGSADLGTVTGRVNEPGRTAWFKLSARF